MKTLTVDGPRSFTGQVRVPGDKSISHRALMIAALGERPCTIQGLSDGGDVIGTRQAMEALGARVDVTEGDSSGVTVTVAGDLRGADHPIDIGNSGTGIRLLAGLVAGRDFTTVIDGDSSIRRRPMDRIIAPLTAMGASVKGTGPDGTLAPLTIEGRPLQGIQYRLPVASAQVKSAVLLAALSADGPTTVHEPAITRTHTEDMLVAAGVRVERQRLSVTVWPCPSIHPPDMVVPGDPSQAAFWLVGACIAPGSDLVVKNVYVGPARLGFVDILARMGADISIDQATGEMRAKTSGLNATTVSAEELPGCVDEVPVLAVAAAAAEGTTVFEGVSELRVKESDRVETVSEMLADMGVQCHADKDTLAVEGVGTASALRSSKINSQGDHRVVMAAAIAGAASQGSVTVVGSEAADTSYPGFAQDLHLATGWTQ